MDTSRLEQFLREKYLQEIYKAVNEERAVLIDFSVFDRFDPVTASQLLEDPDNVLKAFREAAESIAQEKLKVRFRSLPESRNIRIRNLRAKHMNRLWSIDATIKAASEVKPQIYEAIFECPECSKKIPVQQESNILQKPGQCECGRRGDFPLIEKRLYDVRWLQGIEPFEITTGEQPGEIAVLLKEDLTTPRMQKKTDPGSRLTITGVLKELPKRIKGKLSTKMDMYIEANYAEPSEVEFEELDITPEDEKRILELAKDPNVYEKLRVSIAPGLWGFEEIKEAVVLQLFGGIAHHLPDGSRIRGNVHILLTGDPAVGKSVLLKLVTSLVPRGRYVSGSGVTGAGLCTTYDTLIVLENGKPIKIGDFVEMHSRGLKKEGEGIWGAKIAGPKAMSLSQDSLKIKPMEITHAWKIASPSKMLKIRTASGKEITVTKNNPMPVLVLANIQNSNSGSLLMLLQGKETLGWMKAGDLKQGDFIASAKSAEAGSNIFWDEIKQIEEVDGEDFVYDITVEGEHSFVANGLIIHNTASVIKNEVIGSWVLEAGALILCNKGLIGIDEFDKMSRDDQIAMHEAMSVESVSIAKASIVATLPAQTAVLAGANPQYGRFDPYKAIADQIQIPETLLSRFDLKFALKDKPDKVADAQLADHIISTRRAPESIEPLINRNLMRKYIAYAKQIKDIELTEEAAQVLKDFYVDMRNRNATQETNTVSITLRQYEALIRLAEASAKIRLDTKIRMEDADRSIRLMKYSLMQLGYDYETGTIDIDRIEGGMPASRRKKLSVVMEIIDALQKESKEIAIDDIRAEAENRGIEGVDEVIEKLRREGTIFEPRAGFVRKV